MTKKKILVVAEDSLREDFLKKWKNLTTEIEFSDGDSEEDFEEYDIIFDLHFCDDSENFPTYASLKNKPVFLRSVKQSLSEACYLYEAKVKSHLFGINWLPTFSDEKLLEISAFRPFEREVAEKLLSNAGWNLFWVDDRVGMVRPRCQYLMLNEMSRCIEENILQMHHEDSQYKKWLESIDQYDITSVFETLMALYEDTKDPKFLPTQLMKKKYLRGHQFYKK